MARNAFSLSHQKILSGNMGQLLPVTCVDVLPGDTFRYSMSALVRAAPLMAPVMTPTHMMSHTFFVPLRLLWTDFENFITGGPDGTSEPVFPTIKAPAGGFAIGSLADYLGLPTGAAHGNIEVSALPFRALAIIYNEYFRDQDLEPLLTVSLASGLDTTTSTALQNVAWGKDYFTTARPTPQKGPDVFIPLGTQAPIMGMYSQTGAGNVNTGNWPGVSPQTGNITASAARVTATNGTNAPFADLTAATAVTIEDLRFASALQRYYEKMSQFGSRYTEYLRTMFGVKSSDARLQRPEYISGGINTIQFSEVLQTAEGESPVGEMRGHGIGVLRNNKSERFFEEHGLFITLVSVKPVSIYMDGIHRSWLRRSKEEFFVPEFQNLGQQEVLNAEIYADGTAVDRQTFGYQDRFDEYRSQPSTVSGEFRDTLDFWHMARKFASRPTLNADFVKSNPTDRIYAVPSADQLYFMIRHNLTAYRKIASRANPMLK